MADAKSQQSSSPSGRVATLKSKWIWFLAIGGALLVAGILAVSLPEVATFATGSVFGVVLAIAGAVKMTLSLQVKEWSGFIWQELTGAAELVGGILIYFNPLKGALAVTLLIALVLFVQGIMQLILSFQVRREGGWQWFAASGVVAMTASIILALRLPYMVVYEPGIIAGISLLIAGVTYIAISLTIRRV